MNINIQSHRRGIMAIYKQVNNHNENFKTDKKSQKGKEEKEEYQILADQHCLLHNRTVSFSHLSVGIYFLYEQKVVASHYFSRPIGLRGWFGKVLSQLLLRWSFQEKWIFKKYKGKSSNGIKSGRDYLARGVLGFHWKTQAKEGMRDTVLRIFLSLIC